MAKFGDNPLVLEAIFFCYSFLQRISCFCYQANILLVVAELQMYKLGNSVDSQKSFVYFLSTLYPGQGLSVKAIKRMCLVIFVSDVSVKIWLPELLFKEDKTKLWFVGILRRIFFLEPRFECGDLNKVW